MSGTLPANSVVAGAPARRIRSLDDHLDRVQRRNEAYPWRDAIVARQGGYDAKMEPGLRIARVAHFFPEA